MKHLEIILPGKKVTALEGQACGECQSSCQSACKTSCTVANQACEQVKK